MLKIIGQRLASSIPLLVVVSMLMFVFVSIIPGNPARQILGPDATDAEVAALETELGLDQPVLLQYWNWLLKAVQGDLGTSLYNGQSVAGAIVDRFAVTAAIGVAAMLVIGLIGIMIGIISAVRGGVLGRVIDALILVGFALPNFWIALILVGVFASALGWLPAIGYVSFEESPGQWLLHVILPITMLAIGGVTIIAKQTRESMLDALNGEYVDALRAQGIPERRIIFRHALRNASLPVTTTVGLLFASLLSGSVVAEQIFVLPGLGRLALDATSNSDLPMIQGVAVVFVLIVVFVNLLTDLAYGWLNPKVRAR